MTKTENIIYSVKENGSLLDVLRAVQAENGYLTDKSIFLIAEAYGKYPSEVYETATFYSLLYVEPQAEHTLELCHSTCCQAAGAPDLMSAACAELGIGPGETTPDGKWTVKRVECLGRCDTSPNAVLDGRLYTSVTADEIRTLIRKAGE